MLKRVLVVRDKMREREKKKCCWLLFLLVFLKFGNTLR